MADESGDGRVLGVALGTLALLLQLPRLLRPPFG